MSDKLTSSLWMAQKSILADHNSTSKLPESTDVLIIGSGYSGASTAYHLLKDKKQHSDTETSSKVQDKITPRVVLLEDGEACQGASGRNGGHLFPHSYDFIPLRSEFENEEDNNEKYNKSLEEGVKQNLFELETYRSLQKLISDNNIECWTHFTDEEYSLTHGKENSAWIIYTSPAAFIKARQQIELLRTVGEGDIDDLKIYNRDTTAEKLGIQNQWGSITTKGTPINPYLLTNWFLLRSVLNGLKFYTNAKANKILLNDDTDEYKYTVETVKGIIKTNDVVIATNGFTGSILPNFKDSVTTVRGQVVHYSTSVKNNEKVYLNIVNSEDEYLIIFPKHRNPPNEIGSNDNENEHYVVFGGCRHFAKGGECGLDNPTLNPYIDKILDTFLESQFGFQLKKQTQNINDEEKDLIEDGNDKFNKLRNSTLAKLKPLEKLSAWSGIMGFTKDKAPFVGQLPDSLFEKAGDSLIINNYGGTTVIDKVKHKVGGSVLICAGFNGHGMTRVYKSAEYLVNKYLGKHIDPHLNDIFPDSFLVTENRLRKLGVHF